MKVILRPLVTADASWAGVKNYKNCYEDIGVYWTRHGQRYNGTLTEEDRERLGKAIGQDLSTGSDYWEHYFIRTSGKDIILETEEPMDEIKYLYLRGHKKVKDSIFTHKATANFVLVNQEEESKKTNLFNRVKRQAGREFDNMTTDEMRRALRIFGKSAENLKPDVVENRLYEIVEGDPQGFIEKWVNNKSRDTQYLVERAISLNILRKNKRLYTYGTDTIGHGLPEAVAYLEDPKNQDVLFAIQQGVEGKGVIDKEPVKAREPLVVEEKGKQQLSMKPVAEVKEEIKKSSKKK